MSYPEFRELIFEALKEIVPEEITIKPVSAAKINSHIRYGIMFECAELSYAPTIYLEPFYASFQNGSPIEALAEELYCCYIEETGPIPECINRLGRFEEAKKNIFVRMIHIEENKKLLEETPCVKYLDFAIIPYFEVNDESFFKGSILLKNSYLEYWGIDEDTFMSWAIQNTKDKKNVLLRSMSEVLAEFLTEEDIEFSGKTDDKMYVLTNEDKYFGAVLIYFPEVLEMICQRIKEDFYLLPSSVHEWIIIPATQIDEKEVLFHMVKNVNESEVMEEEVLSDNIYYYSANSQKIYVYEHIIDKND